MTDHFLGEIRLFPFGRETVGWMPCEGQLLSVQQYQALYSLLGVQFGGDGKANFALPDLRGRVSIGSDQGGGRSPSGGGVYERGQKGGTDSVYLNGAELPAHTHAMVASTATDSQQVSPSKAFLGVATANLATPPFPIYGPTTAAGSLVALDASTIETAGGSQPHENRQPVLAMSFRIATAGAYPPRQ